MRGTVLSFKELTINSWKTKAYPYKIVYYVTQKNSERVIFIVRRDFCEKFRFDLVLERTEQSARAEVRGKSITTWRKYEQKSEEEVKKKCKEVEVILVQFI